MGISLNQLLLWFLAIPMAYANAWLLKRSAIAKASLVDSVVFYILVMMASMFGGAVIYFEQPTGTGLAEGLGLNLIVMSVGVFAVLHYWTKNDSVEEGESAEHAERTEEQDLQRSIVISRAYVVYFLVMMASMTAVGFVYIFDTTTEGLNIGLLLGNLIMVPGIAMILRHALKHPGDTDESLARVNPSQRLGRWTLVFLVLLNEFVMGWAFILASGNLAAPSEASLSVLASTLNSVAGSDWFLFTLSAEILFSIYMLRRFFSENFIRTVYLQSLILIFVPTAIAGNSWSTISLVIAVALFAVLILFSYRELGSKQLEGQEIKKYVRKALLLDLVAVIGTFFWTTSGNDLVLFAGLAGESILYFDSILERVSVEKRTRISTPI